MDDFKIAAVSPNRLTQLHNRELIAYCERLRLVSNGTKQQLADRLSHVPLSYTHLSVHALRQIAFKCGLPFAGMTKAQLVDELTDFSPEFGEQKKAVSKYTPDETPADQAKLENMLSSDLAILAEYLGLQPEQPRSQLIKELVALPVRNSHLQACQMPTGTSSQGVRTAGQSTAGANARVSMSRLQCLLPMDLASICQRKAGLKTKYCEQGLPSLCQQDGSAFDGSTQALLDLLATECSVNYGDLQLHELQHMCLEEGIAYEGCNKEQLIAKLADQAE
jgi:hypothetical protein